MSTLKRKGGFSLIEVVLAIGIFLITVLALVGLIGPTLSSVDEVEKIDEIASVVNTVNAFLQNSPEIATATASKFETVYAAVSAGGEATLFVYRYYDTSQTGDPVRLEIGFEPAETVGNQSIVNSPDTNPADFANAAGPIYRVVLTPSSAIPGDYRSADRNDDGIYTLVENNVSNYPLGHFAMELRIYAEDPPGPAGGFVTATDLASLTEIEPIFTYNTAIVR